MNAQTLTYGIIGINSLIFLRWNTARNQDTARFMQRNFTTSYQNFKEGRPWTLLTSSFSHIALPHFAVNMFVLHSFGPFMNAVLGNRRFLSLYLGSALSASVSSLAFSAKENPKRSSVGASGAIMGLTSAFACAFPKARINLFFVFPVPAPVALGLFLLYDFTMLNNRGSYVDHAGHLGGLLYGLGYYALRIR
jgi:membrane associated rhomboid family serine protease